MKNTDGKYVANWNNIATTRYANGMGEVNFNFPLVKSEAILLSPLHININDKLPKACLKIEMRLHLNFNIF